MLNFFELFFIGPACSNRNISVFSSNWISFPGVFQIFVWISWMSFTVELPPFELENNPWVNHHKKCNNAQGRILRHESPFVFVLLDPADLWCIYLRVQVARNIVMQILVLGCTLLVDPRVVLGLCSCTPVLILVVVSESKEI